MSDRSYDALKKQREERLDAIFRTPTGVIVEVGGFRFELVPPPLDQMESFRELSRAPMTSIRESYAAVRSLARAALRLSAVANNLLDESEPEAVEVFDEWFGFLSLEQLREVVKKAAEMMEIVGERLSTTALESDPEHIRAVAQIRPPERFN